MARGRHDRAMQWRQRGEGDATKGRRVAMGQCIAMGQHGEGDRMRRGQHETKGQGSERREWSALEKTHQAAAVSCHTFMSRKGAAS
jgi:hypothetical protein